MNLKQTASRLLRYLAPQKKGLSAGVVCFFLSAAIEPAVPALLKKLLDSGFKADLGFPLWLVPVVLIGLFAVRGLLAFSGTYLFNWSTSKAVLALRTDLIRSVMNADASLYNRLSPGVLASRIINDPQNATASLSGAVTTILRDGTTLLALLGYLFYLNWKLTLVTFVTMPLLGYVVRKVQKRVLAVGGQSYESQVRLVGITDDITRAWRVVRTFDAAEFEQGRFSQEAQRLRRMVLKGVAAGATMTPLTQIVASIGVALILTMALVEAHQGNATVGEFVGFITAMLMTISPMRHLTDVSQPIIGGLIGARACFDLMDTPPEPDHGTRQVDPAQCRGEVRFEQVVVTYPGSEQSALSRLDLEIPAGRTVALVGPSGAGKTTVISTLLGFVAPASGRVTLDGIDIQEIRKASLRRQFAVVSQDIVLFDGPIADNVAYAQPKDAARIEACLRAANLWDFVQTLPEGLETPIGTNGSRLSGGQRQRLAIARALYKDAKVWVFDEATSALDTESERVVQQSIEQWHGEKTLVLIAHRLSTVRNADRIYVLSDGRVVEAGTHAELMERGGLYAGMVQAQALE
ncbi:lipid A export permease/ATP-binding protein MsbA [Caldimonas tepidiphila]|uniref:lipid A export permease/ATP-binding protein MsbA n=1 Tax=Caldimonas tepidiphila TaxID=2315841 RepID=UPI000E5A9852|nr:lipid A export permease/ATP-binding protein MsbA [Caldimonas tepidiphila]